MSQAAEACPVASAGKIHLLDLGVLKERLGDKWARMSEHVQMFFKAAIRRALGPGDTFVDQGELSYLVMFRDLSAAEAELKCAAISDEVCRRLFGENGARVSLRSLVAHVGLATMPSGNELDSMLERDGKETIFTRQAEEPPSPAINLRLTVSRGQFKRQRIALKDIAFAYRPVWDLANKVVLKYLCQPIARGLASETEIPTDFWIAEEEDDQIVLDLHILHECLERVCRLRKEGLRVVLATPVHFATISRSRGWRAYGDVLRQASEEARRDVAFVVLGIDAGVPHVRLAQELPKLSRMAYRVFCLLDKGEGASARFARTGAHGVGIAFDRKEDEAQATARMKEIAREAHAAAIDSFVLGLRSTSLALVSMDSGIRFLEGPIVRPMVEDPRHGFAHGLEDLYKRKLVPG